MRARAPISVPHPPTSPTEIGAFYYPAMPAWIRNGHYGALNQCPLFPRKRTLIEGIEVSARAKNETSAATRLTYYLNFDQSLTSVLILGAPFPFQKLSIKFFNVFT